MVARSAAISSSSPPRRRQAAPPRRPSVYPPTRMAAQSDCPRRRLSTYRRSGASPRTRPTAGQAAHGRPSSRIARSVERSSTSHMFWRLATHASSSTDSHLGGASSTTCNFRDDVRAARWRRRSSSAALFAAVSWKSSNSSFPFQDMARSQGGSAERTRAHRRSDLQPTAKGVRQRRTRYQPAYGRR